MEVVLQHVFEEAHPLAEITHLRLVRGVQLAHVGLQLLRPRVEVVHALLYGHGVAGWVGG